MIEKVTGESYYDYVREHVYKPSGMPSTGSEPEDQAVPEYRRKRLASGRAINVRKRSRATSF